MQVFTCETRDANGAAWRYDVRAQHHTEAYRKVSRKYPTETITAIWLGSIKVW